MIVQQAKNGSVDLSKRVLEMLRVIRQNIPMERAEKMLERDFAGELHALDLGIIDDRRGFRELEAKIRDLEEEALWAASQGKLAVEKAKLAAKQALKTNEEYENLIRLRAEKEDVLDRAAAERLALQNQWQQARSFASLVEAELRMLAR